MSARKQRLLTCLIAFCPALFSEIVIDGFLDEEEWTTAREINEFYEVYPYSLDTGHNDTKILIREDEKGMYFGFINTQPKDTIRLNQHQRDQGVRPPIGDQNGVTLDFDNDRRTGYRFIVNAGGSIIDGVVVNENEMNDDWDGDWKQATSVQENGWTSEILIPWSIAPMKSVSTEEREIGICFYRLIISEFRVFATCRGSPYQEKFLSIFPTIKVKKYESGMVINPITISPKSSIEDAFALMDKYKISGIPVVDDITKKLNGILTNRDLRFSQNYKEKVTTLMTKNVVTVKKTISPEQAKELLHKHRIEKLVVVDQQNRCIGLITVKDIEKSQKFPNSCKDSDGRLRVAAATGVGLSGLKRAEKLIESGVDLLVVDTAHGHSKKVLNTIKELSRFSNSVDILGGNVATPDGTKALIDSGADVVKIGIGPGSICTTRMIAGVGLPQLSAIIECSKIAKKSKIPVIADGGIKYSGDLAKAIAAGANGVMVGSLFAGTDEAPGEVFLYQGRSYKSYRGMGSLGAMARGSADRYFQEEIEKLKLVPEGIEGQVPYKGPIENVIHQLVGGLKSAMGYTGNANIESMKKNCVFRKITNAGLKESHVHDVMITRESPNYRQ